jgi:hypothetical protein
MQARCLLFACIGCTVAAVIDRQSVVQRHNVIFTLAANRSIRPIDLHTVGNGCFAVGLDILGTQTLNSTYNDTDLNSLADWLSHTQPSPGGSPDAYLSGYNTTEYQTPLDGKGSSRAVRYPTGTNNTVRARPSRAVVKRNCDLIKIVARAGPRGNVDACKPSQA